MRPSISTAFCKATCERVSPRYQRCADCLDRSRQAPERRAHRAAGRSQRPQRGLWRDALDQLAATPLALRPEHVAEVYTLPPLHKDPFDRILIAQATAEELELVTTDAEIPRYASTRLRVVS